MHEPRTPGGKALRAARKAAGLTQSQLSEMTATPQSTISEIETGTERLRTADAFLFEAVLGLTRGTLATYADDLPATLREHIPGLLTRMMFAPAPQGA